MEAVIGKTRKTAVLRIFQGTEQAGGSGNVAVVQCSGLYCLKCMATFLDPILNLDVGL